MSIYDLSTLYTSLTHNLINENLTELIEQTCNREGSLYLAYYERDVILSLSDNNQADVIEEFNSTSRYLDY